MEIITVKQSTAAHRDKYMKYGQYGTPVYIAAYLNGLTECEIFVQVRIWLIARHHCLT